LLAAAALALFVSPLASSLPDGLDRIAKNLGFEERAVEAPLVAAPIAEYKWEGPWSDATATSVAGVAGALFTFAVGWSLARLLTNVGRSATTPAPMPALSVAHAAAARPPTVLSWSGSTGAAAARSRRILDPYCDVDSLIHRLPAGVKLLTVVSLSFTLAVVPPSPMLWLCVAWLLGFAATLARLSPGHLLRRLLLLEPLALGVAATALLQPHGVEAFTNLAIRSTLCLLAVVLLSSTTPLAAILAALRRVGMPTILLTVIALMHRYVDVMQDESLRLRRARASRTFAGGRRRTWATLASVLAQLFIRTLQRSQRVFAAMTARGWE
ncbi:MAG: PDGLE domain-containing protein, partial [Planctomycetota bacterium]|nr:PDGLE domain-containing protein [Planctomycetota bacterium]